MDKQLDDEERLMPNWKVGEKLIYNIWKKETFNYKDAESDLFERSYLVELTLMEDHIVEAYYPNSLLSPIKLLNAAHPYFSRINHSSNNTLYFEIDENFQFVELKNLDQLIANISFIKDQLVRIIKPEEYEDIIENLEIIEETPSYATKHFAKDMETIHDFYGTPTYDGYYFDLIEKESTAKKIKSKLLSLAKLNLGKIDILQADFIDEHNYQIELLRGHDTVSTMTRQDFAALQQVFISHQFDLKNYDDITLHHQRFIYDRENFILKSYDYDFKIDTPQMKKRMQSRFERIT